MNVKSRIFFSANGIENETKSGGDIIILPGQKCWAAPRTRWSDRLCKRAALSGTCPSSHLRPRAVPGRVYQSVTEGGPGRRKIIVIAVTKECVVIISGVTNY